MKNLLFLGTYLPDECVYKIEKSSQAANLFQGNLIRNLKKRNNVKVLSYIGTPIYEKYIDVLRSSLLEHKIFAVLGNTKLSKIKAVFSYYIKLFNLGKSSDLILMYNYMHISFLVVIIARILSIKTFLIVADFDDYKEEKKILRKILLWLYAKNLDNYDGLIFLSKSLYEKYKTKESLFLEGGIETGEFNDVLLNEDLSTINIIYSGLLNNVTGIDVFLNAIRKCKIDNIKFIFSGRGELVTEIEALACCDSRVEYRGFLSRKNYYKLLTQAHIFINPRNMNLPENENNFPSKILEYLASGKVILSTKFPNYEEFRENIFFCESDSNNLIKELESILKNYKDLAESIFIKNREKSKKFDWKNQVFKIEKFIKK